VALGTKDKAPLRVNERKDGLAMSLQGKEVEVRNVFSF